MVYLASMAGNLHTILGWSALILAIIFIMGALASDQSDTEEMQSLRTLGWWLLIASILFILIPDVDFIYEMSYAYENGYSEIGRLTDEQ